MIHQTCYCDVKPENIEKVKEHTRNWILELEKKWPEPIHYQSFQEKDHENVICYFITFTDKKAEEETSSHPEPRKFGEELYAMCQKEPTWKYHNVIASIRNSKKDSKVRMMVKYQAKPEKVDQTIKALVEFVEEIRKNEPYIRVYESWQQTDEPTKFIHLEEFEDEKAMDSHKNASHTKKFVDLLYPNCKSSPSFVTVELIGSKELK